MKNISLVKNKIYNFNYLNTFYNKRKKIIKKLIKNNSFEFDWYNFINFNNLQIKIPIVKLNKNFLELEYIQSKKIKQTQYTIQKEKKTILKYIYIMKDYKPLKSKKIDFLNFINDNYFKFFQSYSILFKKKLNFLNFEKIIKIKITKNINFYENSSSFFHGDLNEGNILFNGKYFLIDPINYIDKKIFPSYIYDIMIIESQYLLNIYNPFYKLIKKRQIKNNLIFKYNYPKEINYLIYLQIIYEMINLINSDSKKNIFTQSDLNYYLLKLLNFLKNKSSDL